MSGGLNPDNSVRIWDSLTGIQLQEYGNFGVDVLTVAWKPNSDQIVAITAEGLTNEGNSIIIDFETQTVMMASFGIVANIEWDSDETLVAFAGLGETLTSISGEGTIRTWSLADGTLVDEQITNPNYAAAFDPTGNYLALGLAQLPANELSARSTTLDVVQTFADNSVQIVNVSEAIQAGQ